MTETQIGHVDHWWSGAHVAGVHIDRGALHVGDRVHVIGHTSDFVDTVSSIQIDHKAVDEAREGEDVGVQLHDHARLHDVVLLVAE